jgi:endonuclease YncB( thermonuclease family)
MSFLLGAGLIALAIWWALGWLGGVDAERSAPASAAVSVPVQPASPAVAPSSASAPAATDAPAAAPDVHAVPSSDASPKPALLANEQAEAQRFAALKEKAEQAPPKSPPEPKLYYRVEVRDGGTLVAGDVVIKLAGILAREPDAQCEAQGGEKWPCGAAARTALARLIHSRAVTCLQPPGDKKAFAARCKVGSTDLSIWVVRQGWAEPAQTAEAALADAAKAARQDRIGIWRAAE